MFTIWFSGFYGRKGSSYSSGYLLDYIIVGIIEDRGQSVSGHLRTSPSSLTAEMPNLRDARSRLSPSADSIPIQLLGVPLPH